MNKTSSIHSFVYASQYLDCMGFYFAYTLPVYHGRHKSSWCFNSSF